MSKLHPRSNGPNRLRSFGCEIGCKVSFSDLPAARRTRRSPGRKHPQAEASLVRCDARPARGGACLYLEGPKRKSHTPPLIFRYQKQSTKGLMIGPDLGIDGHRGEEE